MIIHPIEKITLYYEERTDIKISMELRFTETGNLFFDGYDFGKFVKEHFGRSDYEYSYTIKPEEVIKLYPLFNLQEGNRSGLLHAVKERFHANDAYSAFGKFMQENSVAYDHFIWR